MADINKTISIEYSANVDKLLTNLKKVPGMTDKEAKKMSKALSTELKKTETAAKKAATANVNSMKKVEQQNRRTTKSYKSMKRGASEMGRGLGELASLAGDSDSEFGNLVGTVAIASMSFSALVPIFGAVGAAAMGMGVKIAMATGGLTVIAGAVAVAAGAFDDLVPSVWEMAAATDEAEKKTKKLTAKEKEMEALKKKIQAINEKFKGMAPLIEAASIRLKDLKYASDAIYSKTLEKQNRSLTDQIILLEMAEGIEKERKKLSLNRRNSIKDNTRSIEAQFDSEKKRIQALQKDYEKSRDAAKAAIIEQFDLAVSSGKIAARHVSLFKSDADKIDHMWKHGSLPEYLKEGYNESIRGLKEIKKLLNPADALFYRREENELIERGKSLVEEKHELELKNLNAAHRKKRNDERAAAAAKEETKRRKEINDATKFLGELEEQQRIDRMTAAEKVNYEYGKQISALQNLQKRNDELAKDDSEKIDTSQAIAALEEERSKKIQEIAEQERKNAASKRDIQMEIKKIVSDLETRKITLQDLYEMEQELRDAKHEDEKQKHAAIMQMITKEEQKRREGIGILIGNVKQFADARMQVLQQYGKSEKDAIMRMFYIQQAASAAQVAFTTAENVAKAQGFAPSPLAPILAGAAMVVGSAQMAAIMAQPPPQLHMGGLARDEAAYTLLRGEGVLSRQGVENIGGQEGLRRVESGAAAKPQIIVLQPFKHFDRYINQRTKRATRKAAQGGY